MKIKHEEISPISFPNEDIYDIDESPLCMQGPKVSTKTFTEDFHLVQLDCYNEDRPNPNMKTINEE